MEVAKRKTLTGSRFLSFILFGEEYCISILKIKEIMGMTEVTAIPQTPEFIKGVINLRGQIIPIIDLRLKFEMPYQEYSDRTCILVVEMEFENEITYMGIVVDTIQEVINIPEESVSLVPYINAKIKSQYIKGIAETGDTIKIILDIEKVLTEEDFVFVKELDKRTNRIKEEKEKHEKKEKKEEKKEKEEKNIKQKEKV